MMHGKESNIAKFLHFLLSFFFFPLFVTMSYRLFLSFYLVIDKISEVLLSFDPTLSIDVYQKSIKNLALVKAMGFSSFETLTAFIDQSLVKNPKAKKVELTMTPEVILANVKANPHLIASGPGKSFRDKLKKYATCSSESRAKSQMKNYIL